MAVAVAGEAPRLDLPKHVGSKAWEALRRLLGDVGRVELHEVFRTTVIRRHHTRQLKADAVELAFDKGLIRAHGRELAVSELELALKSKSNTSQHCAAVRAPACGPSPENIDARAWFGVGRSSHHRACH